MRKKKDPGIRQEAFIHAATALFMKKGYEEVSIRDILDAVADKTASPSVFYYYFSSKDELYRACVEAVAQEYLGVMQEGFSTEGKSPEEWMLSLVASMEKYLMSEEKLILTGESTGNRLFILDMKEQGTRKIADLWVDSLTGMFGVPEKEARRLGQFLSGGIGEMMFSFLTEPDHGPEDVYDLAENIVLYSMNTIGIPEGQKHIWMEVLRSGRRQQEKRG